MSDRITAYKRKVTIYYEEGKKTQVPFSASQKHLARDSASAYAEQVRKTGFVLRRSKDGSEVHYPAHQVDKIIVSAEEEGTKVSAG